jgi:hypothetical protein
MEHAPFMHERFSVFVALSCLVGVGAMTLVVSVPE